MCVCLCVADLTGTSFLFCGGLIPYPIGSIQSLSFHNTYLNNSHCLWLLATKERKIQEFLFVFVLFDTEENDLLQVYLLRDDGEWILNFTRSGQCIDGNLSCPCHDRYYFAGSRFYVTFSSDNNVTRKGFDVSYYSVGKRTFVCSVVFSDKTWQLQT